VIRHGTAKGVCGSLGDPHPFLSKLSPLSESAALGKTVDEVTAREHRGETGQTKALLEQRIVETHHVLAVALRRLAIVSQTEVGKSQLVLRHSREANIPQGSGNGQCALATLNGMVILAYRCKTGDQISCDPPQPVVVTQGLGQGRGVL